MIPAPSHPSVESCRKSGINAHVSELTLPTNDLRPRVSCRAAVGILPVPFDIACRSWHHKEGSWRSLRDGTNSDPKRPTIESAVDSADDRRLIDECLKGRTAAYGDLVRRHQDRLFNTVYRVLGHTDDAQDVVQDTFISAYQSLHTFKGDSQLFTWLYRIAMNAAITLKRKKKAAISLDTGSKNELIIDPSDQSVDNQPGDSMERNEDEARLKEALARLSPEHRAVIVMKDIDDMKYEAIAEILKVPIGTVRSRLHRARLELRELLEQKKDDRRDVSRGDAT